MAEVLQCPRQSSVPARAARLIWQHPRVALLVLRMTSWVAVVSLAIKALPLPRAIRLLEPLAKQELEFQAKESENPPSHDLARVYNNLGNLLRSEAQLARGQDFCERAIQMN